MFLVLAAIDVLFWTNFRSKSYTQLVSGNVVAQAYHNGFNAVPSPINFQNPKTFQIIAPGMDGEATTAAMPTYDIQSVDAGQLDNITNFSNGILEQLVD